jgi:hypothetical protein
LTTASGKQLDFWIDLTNTVVGKKIIYKTGKVEDRRQRLADHYDIDLTAPQPKATLSGPATVDEKIRKAQWAHLRELGVQWQGEEAAKRPFKFQNDRDVGARGCLIPADYLADFVFDRRT